MRLVLAPTSMQLLSTKSWCMPTRLGWLPRLNVESGTRPELAPVAVGAGGD